MVWKRLLRYGILGMLTGIALNYIVAMIASYMLRLGYYMGYPAALPESVGGEFNATLLVMAACGCLGLGIGLMLGLIKSRTLKPLIRILASVLVIAAAVTPLLLLVQLLMQ
jgi:hypothetical protein